MDAVRVLRGVELEYRLATSRGVTPTTQSKRWFFEVPAASDREDVFSELLHRILYDANVMLRRRDPRDESWLALERFAVIPVDGQAMLAWPGDATRESAERHLPWHVSQMKRGWEYAPCYFVDDAGRYDGLEANDYSELVLFRMLAAQTAGVPGAVAFLKKLYPQQPPMALFRDRAQRLAKITTVRPPASGLFRKPPRQAPFASGPPAPHDL